MKMPTLREVGTEARLLLIGIPLLIWTMLPIYHLFLFGTCQCIMERQADQLVTNTFRNWAIADFASETLSHL